MHQFISDTSIAIPYLFLYLGGAISTGRPMDLLKESVKFTIDTLRGKIDLNEYK